MQTEEGGINIDTNRLANAVEERQKALEKVPPETTIKILSVTSYETAAIIPLSERGVILSEGQKAGANDAQIDIRALTHGLARYRQPNHGRSIVEILITIGPFVFLWLLACLSLRIGYGFHLLLAVPAAGFLVRLFIIQHDCGHGSFFRHRLVNDWVGRVFTNEGETQNNRSGGKSGDSEFEYVKQRQYPS